MERIKFVVRTHDGRFEASAFAEWREVEANQAVLLVELRWPNGLAIKLGEAASLCGLTVRALRLQLRIAAIYADRERTREPSVKPLAWIACGPVKSAPRVIEGRSAS
jgi:hypothetical protein